MRIFTAGRDLNPIERERARVSGLVSRAPVRVSVLRVTGDGLSAKKTPSEVSSFVARIDRRKDVATGISNEAYTFVATSFVITTTDGTDPEGNSVDISRGDSLVIEDQPYTVESVRRRHGRLEAAITLRR